MNIPIVAGQFYKSEFAELEKEIEDCFHNKKGPGALPVKRSGKVVKGVLVPHAGYVYSGPCAAWAYKEIAEAKMPDRYVILAPDHNGNHAFPTTSKDAWDMPFGIVQPDTEFVNELIKNVDFIKEGNIREHAVEVQLPMLQFASRDNLEKLKIVPLVVPTWDDYDKIAKAIAKIEGETSIIISSDFTHYGHAYGYKPFKYNVEASIAALDDKAISYIIDLDAEGFFAFKKKTQATICGAYPIMVGIEALKQMGVENVRLLSYYTSSEISGDKENSVSYASILFK
ncbi:AmmeMemoRadiSam system protein B [Candidatus Woesearchaeota archaeon]|nr:MAG: AmmeMemoRadiSam system protein B [Candidatus Woesearchaeota archaeon]